jgi:hypothetical protein
MSFDVLKETEVGAHVRDAASDPRPEVPRVVLAESLPGGTEWLAWIAATEYAHDSVKSAVWEGFKIRPDRSRVQQSRFHFLDQVRAGIGFDLTKSDCAQASDSSLESEINASVSGTKGDVCNCLGSIHTFISPPP